MELVVLATELEVAGAILRESLFARSMYVGLTGLFFAVGMVDHLGVAIATSLCAAAGTAYYHFVHIPRCQQKYNAAQLQFVGALWANHDLMNKCG